MRVDRSDVLTALAACILVSSVGAAILAANTPAANSEPFTEFYALGPDGSASNYPTNLTVGETGRFTVGITNHEHRNVTYTLVVELGDQIIRQQSVSVASGQTWREQLSVTPESTGRIRLRLRLYRGTDSSLNSSPYRRLRLWVDASRA